MSKNHIHIIGGGIIGLCSAYFLQKEGVSVTVLDKGDFSDGASHGNAGMIVPSHFIPLASPGVISKGIKWMFNSKSPFYIKPRLNVELAQWLWRFYKSCNPQNVERSVPVLFDFNEQSKHLYKDFSAMNEFNFHFEEKGLLMLYKTKKQEVEEQSMADQANNLGIETELLTTTELAKLEPDMSFNVRGGLYFKGDAHLHPNAFIGQMIDYLKKKGVEFKPNSGVNGFNTKNGKIEGLKLENEERIKVENVLLCGGSWTGKLAKKLGIAISLQDGKGYSLTFKNIETKPRIPTILSEAKVAITPMGEDLRVGGTLEISNHSTKINKNRLQGILESVPKYYTDLSIHQQQYERVWYGYRPCSPDGMPYIDQSESISNCYVATGHGMMGMSLGPATGKMISEIFTGKKTSVSRTLMKINRF